MRWFTLSSLLLISVLLLGLVPEVLAQAPDEATLGKIRNMVAQLGDRQFARRQMASKELVAVGEHALPVLREAAEKSTDLEIRKLATAIIPRILANVKASKSTGLEWVVIEAGKFQMGSSPREYNRRPDETQHNVNFKMPMLIGAYEVTQEQYQKVMKTNPSWFSAQGGGQEKIRGMDTAKFPVEMVTWFDTIEFCNALSKLDGYPAYYQISDIERKDGAIIKATVRITGGIGYRLPTEAEWENACRGGTVTPYHYGHSGTGKEANLRPGPAIGYGGGPDWPPLNRTAKVGDYKPNRWGLYEMHGNAGEWCWDWYDKEYYTQSPEDDPTGPAEGRHRTVRGGSWLVVETSCRAATRFWLGPEERKEYLGFRVARSP